MMIDRRAFVAGAALVAAAPTRALSTLSFPVRASTMRPVVFMIDGWNVENDDENVEEVRIKVSRGWRTAWR
jgi:hypothetical protein